MSQQLSPFVSSRKKTIEFHIQHNCATQIYLSGSFNHWAKDALVLRQGKNGMWKIKIPMLPKGKYYYKFFVDDRMWVEDVDNPHREPDGVIGWNSILHVV
jgi:1,4-alpha-glucan branching enzyme